MRALYLVTGGSGFLGINLCRHLLARGQAVRTLDIAPFDYPERTSVDAILGDVRDESAVERAAAGVDFVVHAAAALPLATRQDILSTDVEGTRIVLDRAFRQGVRRVVFTSSTSVYGIPDHHPLREEDRVQGVGPYGEAKIAAERICLEQRAAGRCVTILRPKSFVGPERLGIFELLYDWAYEGRNFPVLGSGRNLYQLLDVEDLCAVIERCATLPEERVNDTFNVGAKRFGSMRDNIQAVLDRAGHGRHAVGIPAAPAICVLKLLERLHLSPVYRWIYDTAAQDSWVSIERLENRLGYEPRYSNAEALVRNYEWYAVHRDEYRGRTGISHRVPWNKGALQLARWLF
ncbi:MAG: NAD-dependent epimerase/dehydratase family protein [Nevskia sp.]|nr:NAD-dependent epimerase/dehydratase family protein [Nevskia sp.]